MTESGTSRLYALIIGINDYATTAVTKLKGAVSDAERMRDWIKKDLGVPNSRIRFLRNKEATRRNIIAELKDLAASNAIEKGDPILIYYAGHGAEGPPPRNWHWPSPTIQMILPWDFKMKDGPFRVVQGIPDRTLGFLISNICKAKGDNITVIFDCCHSGSGTRSDGESRVRGIDTDVPVADDLDENLFASSDDGHRGMRVSNKFRSHGLQSHVLLAACAPHQTAVEEKDSGNFTRILLKALVGTSTTEITYEDLIVRMDILATQTPQCEGFYKSRYLFNKKVPNLKAIHEASWTQPGCLGSPCKRTTCEGAPCRVGSPAGAACMGTCKRQKCSRKCKRTILTITAGAIHGVEPGTKFGLWKSRDDLQQSPHAIVTIATVKAYESIVEPYVPETKTLKTFVAQVVGNPPPKLAIYVPDTIAEMKCFKDLFIEDAGRTPLVMNRASSKELASVGLTYDPEHQEIGIEILTVEESEQKIRHVIEPNVDELYRAIEHLSSYYSHRERVNSRPPNIGNKGEKVPFASKFALDIFVLTEQDDDEESGGGLVPGGSNLNVPGVGVDLVVGEHNEDDDYGLLIHNHTDLDVFPYLFSFDSSNFSITPVYTPEAIAKDKDTNIPLPPLKAHSSLPIGYGQSGIAPQGLAIGNPKNDIELGCLRLYLSTKYVDMKSMEQGEISKSTRAFRQKAVSGGVDPIWDCITVPLTLRRGEESDPPEHMIGIIGSRGNGKDTFLSELFKSLHGTSSLKPAFENAHVKEYRITLPNEQPFALVDLPAFQDNNVDNHVAMIKSTMAYLTAEYQRDRQFLSLIWCHNISTNFMGLDHRNVNLVQDLCGKDMFGNVVVLTTHWNKGAGVGTNSSAGASNRSLAGALSPLARYERKEEKLKAQPHCCKKLVEGGAVFKRFGLFRDAGVQAKYSATASIESPVELISSLLSREPQPLQCQVDASATRILGETEVGKRLVADIRKARVDKVTEIRDLAVELARLTMGERLWDEITKEKDDAEGDIERWGIILKGLGMPNVSLM